jgi:hypothetical protein
LNGDGLIVSAAGATHTPLEHSWPVVHAALAFGSEQTCPHPPQLLTSAAVCTSHPVDAR